MALAPTDVKSFIFLDSKTRNRSVDPLPSQFTVSMNQQSDGSANINVPDRVGIGYPIFCDPATAEYVGVFIPRTIEAVPYIKTPVIPANADFLVTDTDFFDKYVEYFDPSTLLTLGTANCEGIYYDSVSNFTYIFIDRMLSNISSPTMNKAVAVRQYGTNPIFRFLSSGTASGSTTITIIGGSSTNNSYVGYYITDLNANIYHTYTIIAYNGTTNVATLQTPLQDTFTSGDIVEIYQVQSNVNPLSNIGSSSMKSSPVNHEISLEWIRVPKFLLYTDEQNAEDGAYTSYNPFINSYSHVVVEFRNFTNPTTHAIQSNDTITNTATFACPAVDTSTTTGSFITLRNSTPCIIKFSPVEPIRFSIALPNGVPLEFPTRYDGFECPASSPYIDAQITALFHIKRLL